MAAPKRVIDGGTERITVVPTASPKTQPFGATRPTEPASEEQARPPSVNPQDVWGSVMTMTVGLLSQLVDKANREDVSGGGPPRNWLVTLAVVMSALSVTVGLGSKVMLDRFEAIEARQDKQHEALVTRFEAVEARQDKQHRALVETLYILGDDRRWSVETLQWLAAQLVPNAKPPEPPDQRNRMREIRRLLGDGQED